MIRKYADIFYRKNVSRFCSAKAAHFVFNKNIRILYIESAKTGSEMTLNELVKLTTLWTTGPGVFQDLHLTETASCECDIAILLKPSEILNVLTLSMHVKTFSGRLKHLTFFSQIERFDMLCKTSFYDYAKISNLVFCEQTKTKLYIYRLLNLSKEC